MGAGGLSAELSGSAVELSGQLRELIA